jgi:hypothetical protein
MDDLKNTLMAPTAEQPLTTAAAKAAGPDKQTRKQAKFSDCKKTVQDAQPLARLLDETNTQIDALGTKVRRNMMSQLRSDFIETKAKKMDLQPDPETPPMWPKTGVVQVAKGLNSTPPKTDIPKANPAFDLQNKLTVGYYKNSRQSHLEPASKAEPQLQQQPQVVKEPNLQTSPLSASIQDVVVETTPDMQFTDFATAMAATGIENLLETAASYLTYIKGIQRFSGPDLIVLFEQHLGAEFDREASWQCIHTTLKSGEIKLQMPAQFWVTRKISF